MKFALKGLRWKGIPNRGISMSKGRTVRKTALGGGERVRAGNKRMVALLF